MRPRDVASMTVLFLTVVALSTTAPGQAVERIDPPSWWVESEDQAIDAPHRGDGTG